MNLHRERCWWWNFCRTSRGTQSPPHDWCHIGSRVYSHRHTRLSATELAFCCQNNSDYRVIWTVVPCVEHTEVVCISRNNRRLHTNVIDTTYYGRWICRRWKFVWLIAIFHGRAYSVWVEKKIKLQFPIGSLPSLKTIVKRKVFIPYCTWMHSVSKSEPIVAN